MQESLEQVLGMFWGTVYHNQVKEPQGIVVALVDALVQAHIIIRVAGSCRVLVVTSFHLRLHCEARGLGFLSLLSCDRTADVGLALSHTTAL